MPAPILEQVAFGSHPRAELRARPATFSQWLRDRIDSRGIRGDEIGLYESSVPEPTDLLLEKVQETFGARVSPFYASAFAKGNPYVLARIAEDHRVSEDCVVCTTGATGSLSLLYRALLSQGDRILVENPAFDLFTNIASAMGVPVDRFERRGEGFAIDPDEVAARITSRTRLVVLSNLHNPSGMAIDADTLRALARIADERGVFVIVDEVYAGYAEGRIAPAASLSLSPRLISISSLTKIFGLSTLRCGWIVGDPQTLAPVHSWSREVEFAISKLSHAVAAQVLHDPAPFFGRSLGLVEQARPVMARFHRSWLEAGLVTGVLPEHGCIALLRLPGIADTAGFAQWLSDRYKVVVVPGEYFGAPGTVRIGFALDPVLLEKGLTLLTQGLVHFRSTAAGGELT